MLNGGGLVAKSCLTLATRWTEEPGKLQFMGFSRPEYWSGLPFPSPGDLPNPGIEPRSPALQADSSPTELQGKPDFSLTSSSTQIHFPHSLQAAAPISIPQLNLCLQISTSEYASQGT